MRAFTLIELLVVLAIIGILAGLVGAAAGKAMAAGHKARDVNNVRQLALILYTDAMDRNGSFRTGLTRDVTETDGTTLEVFQGLVNDGLTDDPAVFLGEGAIRARSLTLEDQNIGFQYVAGYQTSSPSRLPMLFTKGVPLTKENVTDETLAPGASAWGTQGFVVAYIMGNAVWMSAREEGGMMHLSEPASFVELPSSAHIYQ